MEIDSLQRLLEARVFERDKCQEELATFIYPVLTLPSEITSEIFTHFLPVFPARCPLVGSRSPAHLARICRAWRNVALATPTLWNAIELDIAGHPELYERQLHLLTTWLTRSGGCPLSIALVYRGQTSVAAFVEAIVHHASRWQDMELLLPYDDLPHLTGVMPLLRTLTLGPDTLRTASAPVADPVAIFTEAPYLREVMLFNCFNPFRITLPWSQITKLTAGLYEPEAVVILRDAAVLEECCLTLFGDEMWPTLSLPLIPPLLRLRSLALLGSINIIGAAEVGRFLLPALTLPALEAIEVFEPFLGADPVATLSALRPHGCPQRIVISGARYTSDTATPYEMYAAAFPEATVYVDLEYESDSDSDRLDSVSDQPNSDSDRLDSDSDEPNSGSDLSE